MHHSVEVRSPETPRATQERTTFEGMTEALQQSNPELFQDVNAAMHLSAELERSDLSADRMHYLEGEQHELVGELLKDPEAAVLAETGLLARSYHGRSFTNINEGVRSTQFVTRDSERKKADLHFRITDFPSGKTSVSIEVPGRDVEDDPFFLYVDSEAGLTIEQRVYRRGRYNYVLIDPASEKGKDRLWRFFTHTITATDLLDNRSEAERQAADTQARQMFMHKLLHD